MATSRSCIICLVSTVLVLLSLVTISTQQVVASNASSDIPPYSSSPRYWLNGTSNPASNNFPSFRLLPLGWYAQQSQSSFLSTQIPGRLLYIDSANANNFSANAFDCISCDVEDYPGNLGPNDIFRMILSSNSNNGIIFYSTRSNHCQAGDLHQIDVPNGIFTTLDPVLAASVVSSLTNSSAIGMPALLSPDTSSYTQQSSSNNSSASAPPGPTTAVAMIILYTITGIITALFVVIIVTGAIRAHRHPERYGPSNIAGRPRRSRAKGIARAMLDTIPIVKFGEQKEEETPKEVVDIEMAPTGDNAAPKDKSPATVDAHGTDTASADAVKSTNADGTDEAGQLGCSICTEDFAKGDEVRLLPCNHKFHPDCVDPWLLNVSGTCPLCRIDLRPKEEQLASPLDDEPGTSRRDSTAAPPRRESMYDSVVAPPLGHLPLRLDRDHNGRRRPSNMGRRDTAAFASLRSVVHGSREDRIAALRRFRQQRNRSGTEEQLPEEETRGLSSRLRERFRIRTRRAGEEDAAATAEEGGESSTTNATSSTQGQR